MFFCFACQPSPEKFQSNYDEEKVPSFDLPKVLITESGKEITNKIDWISIRRPEILKLFETNVYGNMPDQGITTKFQVKNREENALQGNAIQKEIRLQFTNGGNTIEADLLIFLPAGSTEPVPLFLGYNFYGNHTIHADSSISITNSWVRNNEKFHISGNKATSQSRGARESRWPVERILERGFGLATIYYGDIDPDFDDDFQNGIHSLIQVEGRQKKKGEWSSIASWAWGLSKAMDYLVTDAEISSEEVIVLGHSRLGKTALWAGATDQRFSLVISNDSGCGGAALSRRKYGETVQRINTNFPHWFCSTFNSFNENENELPIDQHQLLALIAPRLLYVASAENDRWADPKGEYLSLFYSIPAYKLFDRNIQLDEKMPLVNQPVQSGKVAYHMRSGKHDITLYDWERFMDFADTNFRLQ
ncbi:MAG: acetylxylan esterase [Bacteroidetes bacterium]|nr:acetylxylan esterase [Bacteroidota bacterium]